MMYRRTYDGMVGYVDGYKGCFQLLIDALRMAPNKDIQALLLQTYIQEYGPLSDANGEVVRQILTERSE